MKVRIAMGVLWVAGVALSLSARAISQEESPPEEAKPQKSSARGEYALEFPSEETLMKAWQKAMTPGKFHKRLEYFLGEWETNTKIWMGGEGSGTPMESKGTAVYRWKMEGRWIEQETTGSMMGMPMHGYGIMGYDNFKKKYVSCFVDNLNTHLLTMDGSISPDGNTVLLYGFMDEPTTGEIGKHVKYITRVLDAKRHVFEVYDMAIGEQRSKVIEIEYVRKGTK